MKLAAAVIALVFFAVPASSVLAQGAASPWVDASGALTTAGIAAVAAGVIVVVSVVGGKTTVATATATATGTN